MQKSFGMTRRANAPLSTLDHSEMSNEHYEEMLLIEMSRAQREVLELPADTGETYDEDGKVVRR